jgi:epoxyqueuosine reductase QueG
MENLENRLRLSLKEYGADMVGIADVGEVNGARYQRAVSIVVAIAPEAVVSVANGPTPEYVQEYHRLNGLLKELETVATRILEESGFRADGIILTADDYERSNQPDEFPHKTAAVNAGLGWIGKSAHLVTEEFGSAVRLATVVTEAPLKVSGKTNTSRCGSCQECVVHCPAKAPKGINWQPGMRRDELFNAKACYRETSSFREGRELDVFVCGICIQACPWTKWYLLRSV